MTSAPFRLLRGLALIALLPAWAVAAWVGSSGRGSPDFNAAVGAAPIVAFLAMVLWRMRHPLGVAAGCLVLAVALAGLWPSLRLNAGLLYFIEHIGTHLALGAVFGRTLFGPGEPLITRFARIANRGVLSARQLRFTRQATRAWTVFFFGNAALSALIHALAPPAVWSIYASLLTAPLIGLMFVAEHLWRLYALPPEERPSVADVVRVWHRRTLAKS